MRVNLVALAAILALASPVVAAPAPGFIEGSLVGVVAESPNR